MKLLAAASLMTRTFRQETRMLDSIPRPEYISGIVDYLANMGELLRD
jgi:hypothetical protein